MTTDQRLAALVADLRAGHARRVYRVTYSGTRRLGEPWPLPWETPPRGLIAAALDRKPAPPPRGRVAALIETRTP